VEPLRLTGLVACRACYLAHAQQCYALVGVNLSARSAFPRWTSYSTLCHHAAFIEQPGERRSSRAQQLHLPALVLSWKKGRCSNRSSQAINRHDLPQQSCDLCDGACSFYRAFYRSVCQPLLAVISALQICDMCHFSDITASFYIACSMRANICTACLLGIRVISLILIELLAYTCCARMWLHSLP
jgi:hypothetical protein